MAFGFQFQWFGDRIKASVNRVVEDRLYRIGERVVARARQLAPVRTGRLRSSIDFVVAGEGPERRTLSIQALVPYAIYQEFGTRFMAPHPYIRPALNEIGRIWGADIEMMFGATSSRGLLATTGRGVKTAGYAMHERGRRLTPGQRTHLSTHLIPGVKQHHRGNVKRAKMTVRRHD